jgi:hypothetical protein
VNTELGAKGRRAAVAVMHCPLISVIVQPHMFNCLANMNKDSVIESQQQRMHHTLYTSFAALHSCMELSVLAALNIFLMWAIISPIFSLPTELAEAGSAVLSVVTSRPRWPRDMAGK